MAKYVIAKTTDVPEGTHIVVDVHGRSVGIFRLDGEFYGLLNRCPHQGGPMCEGDVVGMLESDRPGEYRFDASRKLLACPWHGWEFDIKTGQSYVDPRRTRIRPYPVGVQSGSSVVEELAMDHPETEIIEGPYVAETIPVSVEDDYIVVSTRG